ncbi:MAG: hypothetical protein AAF564_26745, partial [Bacteroidota bacterium]
GETKETKEKQQELKSLDSESKLPTVEEEMSQEEEKPRANKRKTRSSGSDPELSAEAEEDLEGEKELLNRTFSNFEEYDPLDLSEETVAALAALQNVADDIFTAATSNW